LVRFTSATLLGAGKMAVFSARQISPTKVVVLVGECIESSVRSFQFNPPKNIKLDNLYNNFLG